MDSDDGRLKVLIVEDELRARNRLIRILEHFNDRITICGSAKSVSEAYGQILKHKPDLVFLDVEMPRETGFDLLEKFQDICFDIVFTTGHEGYAIQAIKFSALDYLLKPIKKDEVSKAIEKSIKSGYKSRMTFYENLLENLRTDKENQSIILKENDKSTVVRIADIVRFESDRNYSRVYINTGETMLLSKTLKVFDDLLKGCGFLRIHKSHLINSANIDKILLKEHCVLLTTGKKVKFSTRKKKELSDFLQNMNVR